MSKLVSIIIPIYNAEKFLKTTMDCILKQKYRSLEVVAVNDCSTDTSSSILNEYKSIFFDAGLKYTIVNKEINEGLCAAINDGLIAASGEYYCFPDADDELMPDYVSAMMEILEENPEKQWVRSDYTIVLEAEDREYDVCLPSSSCYKNDFFDFISKFIPHNAWNMIVSKEYFEKCIGKQILDSRLTQEWSILLPLSYYSDYARCSEKLYRYHIRTGAMSSWQNADINSVIAHIDSLEKLNLDVLKRIDIKDSGVLELSVNALEIYYHLMQYKKYIQHNITEKAEQEKQSLFSVSCKMTKPPIDEAVENLDMYVRMVFDKILCAEITQNKIAYRNYKKLFERGYEVYADEAGIKLLTLMKKAYGNPVKVSLTDYPSDDTVNLPKACLIENSQKYKNLKKNNSNQEYIDYRDLRNSIRGWASEEGII